jgi:hypothetical protein
MALVKYNNNSLSAITATAGMPAGAMTLIKEQTASSSGTIDFVNGASDVVISSAYPIYLFKFINVHPQTDDTDLTFNFSIDTGSNYNVTKTTTYVWTYHYENDSAAEQVYETGSDLAQATGFQKLGRRMGNANDESQSGELWLFNPSSTTFVKHFMATAIGHYEDIDGTQRADVAGYVNSTSAVDAAQFKMSSGNIDTGTFKLYGIKDS